MITIETATDIAMAHREIETAEKLIADVRKAIDSSDQKDIRDVFGRRADGFQLGVPRGPDSRCLFNVPYTLAIPVIETHIAASRAKLAVLCDRARIELGSTDAPVRALVIAARQFWDEHNDLSEESKTLDEAPEPFAELVAFAGDDEA